MYEFSEKVYGLCYNGHMSKALDKVYETLLGSKTEMTALELSQIPGLGGRTYVSRLLAKLIADGKVISRRSGRNVYYKANNDFVVLDEELKLVNLSESDIWYDALKNERFREDLSEKAETILSFTFTEMLNNAIDHSKSGIGRVKIWKQEDNLEFDVRDFGIGIFKGIMAKRKLETELDAVNELLKGKMTTNPELHSGEGIFWTGKIADKLVIESYGLRLTIDNILSDYAIEKNDERLIGTLVHFEIAADTEKSMSELFHQFSFDKQKLNLDTTIIPIKLYNLGETWISRSQAKKVLDGLDKFKKIILDFGGVEIIGQGFADEIFRVFKIHHPEIEIEAINMNRTVELMVERARNDKTGREQL